MKLFLFPAFTAGNWKWSLSIWLYRLIDNSQILAFPPEFLSCCSWAFAPLALLPRTFASIASASRDLGISETYLSGLTAWSITTFSGFTAGIFLSCCSCFYRWLFAFGLLHELHLFLEIFGFYVPRFNLLALREIFPFPALPPEIESEAYLSGLTAWSITLKFWPYRRNFWAAAFELSLRWLYCHGLLLRLHLPHGILGFLKFIYPA